MARLQYPGTNFHDLNLDWILKEVKRLSTEWLAMQEEWTGTKEQWEDLYNYVHDYFDDLDVQNEVDDVFNRYVASGDFFALISPTVQLQTAATTTSWLGEHVDPETGYVLDNTLTIEGAAADAKATGGVRDALHSAEDQINIIHSLVDYKYHTAFFRAPDPSASNTLKLGIQRDETFVILNGTLDYSSSTATKVRLNGTVATTYSSTQLDAWTTDTLSLITGHQYKAIAQYVSGTVSGMTANVPAVGILRSGEHELMSAGTRPNDNIYVATFTAEESTTYNITLYCSKGTTFTNAKYYVYLLDQTAYENEYSETQNRIKAMEMILEEGYNYKWGTDNLRNGYYSGGSINSSNYIVCIKSTYPVQAGDILKFENNTDGLWFAYGVYPTSGSGTSDSSGWITGESHQHTISTSGNLFVQFANAQASADRTELTPADITLDFGMLDNGFVVNSIEQINKTMLKVFNPATKTIAFLGDSLTAGVGTNKIYHMYLGSRFGWTCKNYGYGGSGYARKYPSTGGKMATGQTGMGVTITSSNKIVDNDFASRIASIDTTVDALVIFGGTNDWAHGDDVSVEAFTTAVNQTFTYAQTNFGRIPIIVLLPVHRLNDTTPNATTGKTLTDYCELIKEIARPYGIKCIDLMAETGLNPANENNNTLYYVRDDSGESDGLHPNHYAHQVISNVIASVLYNYLYS